MFETEANNIAIYSGVPISMVTNWLGRFAGQFKEIRELKPLPIEIAGAIVTGRTICEYKRCNFLLAI